MTYVLADIHGRGDRFHQVLDRIALRDCDSLYILGDVVDRNPDGISLLQEIMAAENMHMLLGNHEHMMIQALEDPGRLLNDWIDCRGRWYYNGGQVTENAFRGCSPEEQRRILAYLKALPLNISLRCRDRDYLLVHGSPASEYRPEDPEYEDRTSFAVWNRLDPFRHPEIPGLTVLCGHTPTSFFSDSFPMEVFRRGNILCIDCGCAYPSEAGGRLACICLESGEICYSDC